MHKINGATIILISFFIPKGHFLFSLHPSPHIPTPNLNMNIETINVSKPSGTDVAYLTGSTGFVGQMIVKQCEADKSIGKILSYTIEAG